LQTGKRRGTKRKPLELLFMAPYEQFAKQSVHGETMPGRIMAHQVQRQFMMVGCLEKVGKGDNTSGFRMA